MMDIAWSPHSLERINFALSVTEDGISFAEKRVGSSDKTYPSYEMYYLPQNTYGRHVRITIQNRPETIVSEFQGLFFMVHIHNKPNTADNLIDRITFNVDCIFETKTLFYT